MIKRFLLWITFTLLLSVATFIYGDAPEAFKIRNTPQSISYLDIEKIVKANNFFDNKINIQGNFQNDFVDNGDDTITDRMSQLMWHKIGSDMEVDYKNARMYVKELNKSNFANYDDWRFPTIEELYTLLASEKHQGFFCHPIFTCSSSIFWSIDKNTYSTAGLGDAPKIIGMNFEKGTVDLMMMVSSETYLYEEDIAAKGTIRAVRSLDRAKIKETQFKVAKLRSIPIKGLEIQDIRNIVKDHNFYDIKLNKEGKFNNIYKDNGDGTITDRLTGLMWEKIGSSKDYTYYFASKYIESLNNKSFAGYNNWRIPTTEELYSLLEPKTILNRHIDPVFDYIPAVYWTIDRSKLPAIRTLPYRRNITIDFNAGSFNEGYLEQPAITTERGYPGTFKYCYIRAVRSIE